MLEIRYDDARIKQLERELRAFGRTALPRVMSRGLNRTATQARTKLSRLGSKRLGWRIKDVKSYIILKKASYKNWRCRLEFPKRTIPLIHLKAVQQKKGVKYKDPITGKRIIKSHAFIATGDERGRQVWLRSEHAIGRRKYIRWAGRKMEALFIQKAPSLKDIFMVHAADEFQNIFAESKTRLERNIHDQVQLILRRRLPA